MLQNSKFRESAKFPSPSKHFYNIFLVYFCQEKIRITKEQIFFSIIEILTNNQNYGTN